MVHLRANKQAVLIIQIILQYQREDYVNLLRLPS